MNMFLFLLIMMLLIMNLSSSILWFFMLLIFVILLYCSCLFLLTKSILSFLCFLTYVSAILVILTYMVIVSSMDIFHTKIFMVSSLSFIFLLVTNIYWFMNMSAMFCEPSDIINMVSMDFIFSVLFILIIQLFIYSIMLDFKSLRLY